MSDLLLHPEHAREPLQDSFSDEANPIGLDGVEFIEYATSRPAALGQVLEMMGFRPVARHRSREVLLYRQGGLNIVVNAHPDDAAGATHGASTSRHRHCFRDTCSLRSICFNSAGAPFGRPWASRTLSTAATSRRRWRPMSSAA